MAIIGCTNNIWPNQLNWTNPPNRQIRQIGEFGNLAIRARVHTHACVYYIYCIYSIYSIYLYSIIGHLRIIAKLAKLVIQRFGESADLAIRGFGDLPNWRFAKLAICAYARVRVYYIYCIQYIYLISIYSIYAYTAQARVAIITNHADCVILVCTRACARVHARMRAH